MEELKEVKTDLSKKTKNFPKCIHEFITDLIDIHPERSQIITYCVKCNLVE